MKKNSNVKAIPPPESLLATKPAHAAAAPAPVVPFPKPPSIPAELLRELARREAQLGELQTRLSQATRDMKDCLAELRAKKSKVYEALAAGAEIVED